MNLWITITPNERQNNMAPDGYRIPDERTAGDERICAGPGCPYPGKHVRKDEGATDLCPLVQERPHPGTWIDSDEDENAKSLTTMAEEEPARRDRRNWLDGYLMGFREGFERGGL